MSATHKAVEAALERMVHATSAYAASAIFMLEIENAGLKGNQQVKKLYDDMARSFAPIKMSPRDYFRCTSFFGLVSSMEIFFQDLIKCIIKKHPRKIGNSTFKLSEILEMRSEDEIIDRAIDEYLNKVMYKKPMEYLAELCEVLSIDRNQINEKWPLFVEAKARRDVGIHNNWVCNDTYIRKITEAGMPPTCKAGDRITPTDAKYVMNTGLEFMEIAKQMASAVIKVHP